MFKIFKKTMMISELIELYQQGRLNLSPYYQRTGKIWKTAKKQNLIDSILNQIDLPKFYFHFYPEEENGKYDYSIIDGKQRILAIMDFVEGKINLSKSFKFLDGSISEDIQGFSYEKIQEVIPEVIARFLLFEIDVVFVDTDDIERINEMFIRINEGVAVNNAEKRNAYGGKLIQKIRACCADHIFFNKTIAFENGRDEYQEIFLKLFVLEYKRDIISLTNKNIESVVKECKDCKNKEEEIIIKVSEKLLKMSMIFGEKSKILKKNNIVTYYLFLQDKYDLCPEILGFIENFERERKDENLNDIEKRMLYLKYNDYVKQGTYQERSFKERLNIMNWLYDEYVS